MLISFCSCQKMSLPTKYDCVLGPEETNSNMTKYTCSDFHSDVKSPLNLILICANAFMICLALLEIMYLCWRLKRCCDDKELALLFMKEEIQQNGRRHADEDETRDETDESLRERTNHSRFIRDETLTDFLMQHVKERQASVKPFSDDDAQRLSDDLKKNILVQTKVQPGLFRIAGTECKMDEIFTNIKIRKGRKPLQDRHGHTRREKMFERYEDIFIDSDTKELHNSIFLTGKPGIGKTFFCLKMLRDWANKTLFQHDFKFVFYITFRQLNLYEKEHLTLVDILRRSRVDIDETAFRYIKQHSNQVLFILDGFDEFNNHQSIVDMKETKYADDPLEKMPVSYLISKLMKKNILAQSVVLVTSRPTEKQNVTFNLQAEILGFDEQQFIDYIFKYFKDDINMADKVINHLNSNQLVSFSCTPLTCQLMCYCLHHLYRNEGNVCNVSVCSFTLTDLYLLLIDILLSKVHSDSKFRCQPISEVDKKKLENTLDKLYKLAGNLYVKKKFDFNDNDLKEFDFSDEEITEFKKCGLIVCGPEYNDQTGNGVTHDYCFLHLTIQEFFAAHFFVKNFFVKTGDIPQVSEVVCQFIAGLAGKKKNEECMRKLMERVLVSVKRNEEDERKWYLPNVCLQDYGDDEFAKKFLLKLIQECGLYESHKIRFITWGSYVCGEYIPGYLITLICLYNEEISSTKELEKPPQIQCALKMFDTGDCEKFCDLFSKCHCNLTEVHFDGEFVPEYMDTLCRLLYRNPNVAKLTFTNFGYNTDDFPIESFWRAIKQCSNLTDLSFEQGDYIFTFDADIMDVIDGRKLNVLKLAFGFCGMCSFHDLCEALSKKPLVVSSLYLSCVNERSFTVKDIECLCNVIRSAECGLNKLSLCGNFDDTSLAPLWQTLKDTTHSLNSLALESDKPSSFKADLPCEVLANSKLTSLALKEIDVTDENIMRLSQALDNGESQLTTLKLYCNISESFVGKLCDVLEKGNSQLTQISLRLPENESCCERVCQTIKVKNCKLESLKIKSVKSDKYFSACAMLVKAFQSENCAVKRLVMRITKLQKYPLFDENLQKLMTYLSNSLSSDSFYEFIKTHWVYKKNGRIDFRKKCQI